MKSGSLKLLEPSGPDRASNGTALSFSTLSVLVFLQMHNVYRFHCTLLCGIFIHQYPGNSVIIIKKLGREVLVCIAGRFCSSLWCPDRLCGSPNTRPYFLAELKQPKHKTLLHVRPRLKIHGAVISCPIPLDGSVHRTLLPFTLWLRYVPHNLTSLIFSFRVRIWGVWCARSNMRAMAMDTEFPRNASSQTWNQF
jgi:hypothetical protein